MIQVRLLGFNSRIFIETSEKGFLLSFYFSLSELKMGWKSGRCVVRTRGELSREWNHAKEPRAQKWKEETGDYILPFESLDREMSGHITCHAFQLCELIITIPRALEKSV